DVNVDCTNVVIANQSSSGCTQGAPVRHYDVSAINVDITLNRYLDHEPQGRMYALTADVSRIRQEEAANARARTTDSAPGVSLGLQGDAIQPLTLRVNQGECLQITFQNTLRGEIAGIDIHGTDLHLTSDGSPAIA